VGREGWLTTRQDLDASRRAGPPWRMDSFYRQVRRRTGILMDGGKPLGGKLSHDADNRRPWPGDPPAPEPPRFRPDEVTVEVGELVEQTFTRHPGALDLESLPATRQDAERLWSWARSECLHDFGPFEDAMSAASSGLFHTRISALLNLHRLLPAEVVRDVAGMDLPLASKEGFIRQVLGWREFVHHVHEATDGFRSLPGTVLRTAGRPGDGGWSRWSGASWDRQNGDDGSDGGAMPDHLEASSPLPVAYWGRPSGLACLDRVVAGVWRELHHPHPMVLANIATLLGVSPRELTDWFWVAYTDAYDWVVEPNVLGMGSFATGPLMTTKPYLCGAAYIDRMSDYCAGCAFDPKRNCPISNLYWAFLDRQRGRLEPNPRMRVVMNALGVRPAARLDADRAIHRWAAETLGRGEVLRPEDRPGGRPG
jgi:deoxyribodipyrimidine photolyase-related protein